MTTPTDVNDTHEQYVRDNEPKAGPFVPVAGQSFSSHGDWVRRGCRRLTSHPDYHNTQHQGGEGWRGEHFVAMCFDQLGRRCRWNMDSRRAEDDGAYPIWWVWPDQIAGLLMGDTEGAS